MISLMFKYFKEIRWTEEDRSPVGTMWPHALCDADNTSSPGHSKTVPDNRPWTRPLPRTTRLGSELAVAQAPARGWPRRQVLVTKLTTALFECFCVCVWDRWWHPRASCARAGRRRARRAKNGWILGGTTPTVAAWKAGVSADTMQSNVPLLRSCGIAMLGT